MNTYARIHNGVVAELLTTTADPTTLFNPALVWEPVTSSAVAVGWLCATGVFSTPPAPSLPVLTTPSLAQLQAELAALTVKIAALSAVGTTTSGS